MSKAYQPSSGHAAEYGSSANSLVCFAAVLTVVSTVGTCTIYGPPVGAHKATPDTAYSAVGALRPGHRFAIYGITGTTNAVGGTFTATIWTFHRVTVIGSTGTADSAPSARASNIVSLATTGGWSLYRAANLTPFAPVPNLPLYISDPMCGTKISVAAAGSDAAIAIEIIGRFVPTEVPGLIG